MNLATNARDSITGVGRIGIQTENATIEEADIGEIGGFDPGEYVKLTISDDGCGMDREVLLNIFEPFFTTKRLGTGTGLGLATVYGIVKQNHGNVGVYSEPGQGTIFVIYLPRDVTESSLDGAEATEAAAEAIVTQGASGAETVLLVEDEAMLLKLAQSMLEKLGYRVLAATSPSHATRIAREHCGKIHLLMTDVVMPEMNGRELAGQLLSLHPGLRQLFMSGYTSDVIARHGVLEENIRFIQKPFSLEQLAAEVRKALD